MAVSGFLAEMKRRHVYRAGGAYAVVAFGLIEIVSNVTPMLDLPAWIGRALILVLIVGFPLTLLAACMIDAKPAESAQGPSTSKLDFALMGALVLVVGLLVYQQIAPSQKAADIAAASGQGVSIAVLPFVNLSGDPSQEFFSDGMTEEITSALAKVRGMQVVGRTSAFEFKGQNKDLHAIGQALRASYLLEGSVRKSGNRVRITGQLIRADSGTHIWTENYDRELTDIFQTQDDIARAIAAALQAPLGLKAGETLVANRNISPENYQQYLRAKALMQGRVQGVSLAPAAELLEAVVAQDSAYVPAWGLLAQVYAISPTYDSTRLAGRVEEFRQVVQTNSRKAEVAARRTTELEPDNTYAGLALASLAASRGRLRDAEALFSEALKRDPENPEAMHGYSLFLGSVGRIKEAIAIRQSLRLIEPLVPSYNSATANALWADGQPEAALRIYNGRLGPVDFVRTNASQGRFKEAAEQIRALNEDQFVPGTKQIVLQLLEAAPSTDLAPDWPNLGNWEFVALYVGAPERALDIHDRQVSAGYWSAVSLLTTYQPSYAPARKTARYKELVRKAGLVEYWRARGWPDVCHPDGADDFECS